MNSTYPDTGTRDLHVFRNDETFYNIDMTSREMDTFNKVELETTPEQDQAAIDEIDRMNIEREEYSLTSNNCVDSVKRVLVGANKGTAESDGPGKENSNDSQRIEIPSDKLPGNFGTSLEKSNDKILSIDTKARVKEDRANEMKEKAEEERRAQRRIEEMKIDTQILKW